MVGRVAQRAGLSPADAADVQQATWVQLIRHADQVRDPERIGAWLATTARRQSQRVAMARSRQALSADPWEEYGWGQRNGEDVAAVVVRDHYEPVLDQALGRLPASYRRVLELLSSDATPSYEEVARALGLPVGSIGPMRIRALQLLRRDGGLRAHRSGLASMSIGARSRSCPFAD
jgi:RNA polymerase sigma factor (sigma-70 family)